MNNDFTKRIAHLRAFDGHRNGSLALLDLMEKRAAGDPAYKAKLLQWLREGSTVFLRDELAAPFQSLHDMATMKGRLDHFNAWACLDSVGMYSRDALDESAIV